jgi:hypothetical protein
VIEFGLDTFTISLISIIMTAPVGTILIYYGGEKWLEREIIPNLKLKENLNQVSINEGL